MKHLMICVCAFVMLLWGCKKEYEHNVCGIHIITCGQSNALAESYCELNGNVVYIKDCSCNVTDTPYVYIYY